MFCIGHYLLYLIMDHMQTGAFLLKWFLKMVDNVVSGSENHFQDPVLNIPKLVIVAVTLYWVTVAIPEFEYSYQPCVSRNTSRDRNIFMSDNSSGLRIVRSS